MSGKGTRWMWTHRPDTQRALVSAVGALLTFGMLVFAFLWVAFKDGSLWLHALPLVPASISVALLLWMIRHQRRRSTRTWTAVPASYGRRERPWRLLDIYGVVLSVVLLIVSAGLAANAVDQNVQRVEVGYQVAITPDGDGSYRVLLPIPKIDDGFTVTGEADARRVLTDKGAALEVSGAGAVVVTASGSSSVEAWPYDESLSLKDSGDARRSSHHAFLEGTDRLEVVLTLSVKDCSGVQKRELDASLARGWDTYEVLTVQHAEGECLRPWDVALIPFMLIGGPIMSTTPFYVGAVAVCAAWQARLERRQAKENPESV